MVLGGRGLDVPVFSVCVQGCGSGTMSGRRTALPSTPAPSSSSRKPWPPKIDTRRYTHPSPSNPSAFVLPLFSRSVHVFFLADFITQHPPLPAVPLCFGHIMDPSTPVRMFLRHQHSHRKDVGTLPLLNFLLLRLLHHHPTNSACCHGN